MKILVTGGAGFIGSHVVDAYIKAGHEVVVIDNLSNGVKENINPKAKFYEMDIRDSKVEDVMKQHNFDIVNHHAAQINVRESINNPREDYEINVDALMKLLGYCVKYNVKKFINISSGGAIYDVNGEMPLKENAKKQPSTPYGLSKLSAEYYLNYTGEYHDLKFTTLRYANIFGPRQNPEGEAGVISIFISKMMADENIEIFGSGKQTRDFVYVKDVVQANLLAIENADNEAVNIGTGKETSVNELFEKTAELMNYSKEAEHIPEKKGDVMRNSLDVEKAKQVLKWEPKYGLEKGLRETIQWFRK